jgi:MFS family permease
MSRKVAVIWHASFVIVAGVLYFFFVLPRWPELLGDWPFGLGMAMRIVTGALIGLGALPVVFTLLRTRPPEFGTPQLALTLRTSSIALHVFAGALIIGTAISEIWLSLDSAGQWLFGIYGAAAAIALLGMFAFYLAFVAELPPPPPKPLKVKERRQRGRGKAAEATEEAEETEEAEDEDEVTAEAEASDEEEPAEVTAEADEPAEDESAEAESTNGKLRNRRPSGKAAPRRRRRLRGGVAVED